MHPPCSTSSVAFATLSGSTTSACSRSRASPRSVASLSASSSCWVRPGLPSKSDRLTRCSAAATFSTWAGAAVPFPLLGEVATCSLGWALLLLGAMGPGTPSGWAAKQGQTGTIRETAQNAGSGPLGRQGAAAAACCTAVQLPPGTAVTAQRTAVTASCNIWQLQESADSIDGGRPKQKHDVKWIR